MPDIYSIKNPADNGVNNIYCIGQGYGSCNTNSSTSGDTMEATLTGYKPVRGFVAVRFRYDVPASANLRINSNQSADIYPIKFASSAIVAGAISANETVIFYFDGSAYNIVSNDHGGGGSGYELTLNKVTSLSSSSTDTQYPSAKCVFDIIGDIESLLAAI